LEDIPIASQPPDATYEWDAVVFEQGARPTHAGFRDFGFALWRGRLVILQEKREEK
jgi:hypothetical protein